MHAWLKRAVAGLLSAGTLLGGGLLTAGTANADEIRMPDIGKTITSLTASAATTYPRELVNGGFDYLPAGGWNVISPKLNTSRGKFTSVDPVNGQYIRNAHVTDGNVAWVKWDGFDASKFGWISDQKGGKPQGFVTDHANSVELQRDNDTDNTYAEIVGSEIGKSIYQKIDTQNSTDAVYTVRFDHAALSSEHADGMQALVNGKPVTMTRIGGNKAGDKTGWTGTDIVTHATNTDHYRHDGQWATYEGKVTIPANTPVSTFMFKSLNEAKPDMGNLIDNLTFKIAYRLSYDSNGGTKAKASQISSRTEGKASETDGKVKTVADDAAGSIPSNETAGAVKQAKSKTNGSVRLAADDDVAEYAANGLPDHLVNGDFEYPSMKSLQHYFAGIDRNRSQWISNGQGGDLAKWSDIPGGLDTTRFGWSSTQTQGAMSEQRANAVELQKATGETTQMGELCASQKGTAIYQDIATTPGTLYRIELDHASRYSIHLDQMQVMVGAPGHERPVEMTRTSSNKYGDKIGEKSTTIATHSTNPFGNQSSKDDFSHYVGYYTIPAGQSVTRFTFRQVSGVNTTSGNLLDNIVFNKAYRLSYDKNASDASGQVPSNERGRENTVQPAKAKTTGTVKTVADENVRYGSLANGDFSYPSFSDIQENEQGTYADLRTFLKSDDGTLWYNMSTTDLSKYGKIGQIPGFDSSRFAWSSTENGSRVELQQDRNTKNTYAEIVAQQDNTSIYQNVSTGNGGVLYKIRLKHASRQSSHADKMQVLVGSDTAHATPVEMTRVTSNGHGDKVGGKSTIITTKVSNTDPRDHGSQWETYEGYYQVPEGQKNTVFMFKSLEGFKEFETLPGNNVGNLVDDIEFSRSYKLTYDKNASDATGKVPSNQRGKENTVQPAKSKTTGSVGLAAGKTVSGLTVHDLKKNDKGKVPSSSKADSTQPAAFKAPDAKAEAIASKANGTVRLAADGDTEPESGTTTDDRGILTDTIARQDDGTRQRTITRSDGSVRVETIATTGAVSGCQVYYPAGTRITLATAKIDSDCWDSSQISKTNRTFYGWSANTDANDRDVPVGDTMDRNTLNANVRTEIVMPARAKTVYALWAINPTLSYNVNAPAGSNAPGTPASQTVPYNTAAADKSGWAADDTGKIPGYRFDGWYTAPNGGNKYDFNTPLTNNVTVYAHWIGNGYTVRFTGNGATGGNTPDQAFQYNIGQNLRRNGFTRDGYTFTGWKRADNQQAYGDGQWVTNLTTQPNGIVTMVAQWSANEAHIRYNPNPPAGKTTGGQGTPNWDGHTGDTPAIGGNGWTIDGYTFAGWTTSPDGSGARYAPGARWTANGTLTLYAQWTPGQAGLTYDGNGATGGKTDPQNGVTDQKVNVRQNGFTRDGYTFVRWDTQADCRGKAVNLGDKWTLQGSSTLYACWAGNVQTLTYHGNGATDGNTAAQSGKTGDELTTNANGFTRDGYTFVEWNTKADGTGGHYGKGTNGVAKWTMLPAGNDLYAIWQANPANIRYRDDWGATGSTPDTTGVTGQNVTIAQNGFTRPGYTFTGWARDRRTDPSLQPGGRYTLTPGTTTLWAQWKADPAHLIYNSNSGSTSQTRRTDGVVDQTLTVIANPFTRTGYTFTGWNTQADGRGRAYTAGNGFRLVADPKSNPVNTSVLYAQWRINRVTLKFNPNGGTGGYPDITVDAFTTVTIPADAKEPKVQRPGFRFTGWAMKPTPGAGDTILSPGKGTVSMPDRGSITVYAQWAPAMTTLPFTGGHAQVPTIGLYAGLAFMILAMGALMPVIRLRMGAGSKGRHAGTPTIGRHSR